MDKHAPWLLRFICPMPADNKIQPYAFVAVLDATTLEVRAASKNLLEWLGADAGAVIGQAGHTLFARDLLEEILQNRHHRVPVSRLLTEGNSPVDWGQRQLIPFFTGNLIVMELEHVAVNLPLFDREIALHAITNGLAEAESINNLLNFVCSAIAKYMGLDRVTAYQFEEEGMGIVRNEYNNGSLDSLLKLRFRAEDFPAEGFRLHGKESVLTFLTNYGEEVPMIGDVGEASETINYVLGCRTPYPVLAQFARESGIETLLSVALFVEGKPWGVLFGHARRPMLLNYQLRTFLHLIGTLTSQSIAYRIVDQLRRHVLQTDVIRSRFRELIASAPTLVEGLTGDDNSVMRYISDSKGAAVVIEDQLIAMGNTPSKEEIRDLLAWAREEGTGQAVWSTNHLEAVYATDGRLRATAAGVILVPLNSRRTEWIAWFRPEKIEEVRYGSIDQSPTPDAPRARFYLSTEVRRGYSRSWSSNQLRAATELQSFIRDVVMERYSQLRRINQQLKTAYSELEDFSYMVSHDLRAPLRGIDGFAEILLEDYGQGIDEVGRELIHVIQHNAARMNQFIADILELSRVGRATIIPNELDITTLVRDAVLEISEKLGLAIEVTIHPDLPPLVGDQNQMSVVIRQLISNAVKFSRLRETPIIEVGYRPGYVPGDGEFFISDNGIGIPLHHQQRVFGMFNRLVTQEEYAGNGVGLAIVRRIINRHHGDIRIESTPGGGGDLPVLHECDFTGEGANQRD